jgi:N-hydroxyarylamine O-acetyltransferase
MISTGFPLMQYLERIGLSRPPDPDEEGLRLVHTAQAFSIPFENIEIHLGRSISLKPVDLVEKILRQKRGGYCFELNGILYQALKALGFSVRPHMARVLYGRTAPSERTHEVLVVAVSGEKWLADTGFGGPGLRAPIPITTDLAHEQFGERYRLRRDPDLGLVLQKETRDLLLDLYAFNEDELTLEVDIEMGNHFTSTSPLSIFRLHRMCSLAQSWGRVTLNDMELTMHRDGQSISRTLPPGPEYMAALAKHFGIDVGTTYEELMPLTKSIRADINKCE